MVVPMLDEQEWVEVEPSLRQGIESVKDYRRGHSASLGEALNRVRYEPALDAYERLTGFRETNHLALWHHRLSLYGPPCTHCGKPLRTPEAKLCAACGTPRGPELTSS
jgi:hypothetical protein